MNKCQTHPESEAVFLKMCESCLEGLLEDYAGTELEQAERIARLEAEMKTAVKCNSCMSRQISKLTDEPLSCNPIGDECDQDWRDKGRIAELERQLTREKRASISICQRDINQQKELARLNKKVSELDAEAREDRPYC